MTKIVYPASTAERVRELYATGLTQRDAVIAAGLPCTNHNMASVIFRRLGVEGRRSGWSRDDSRARCGPNHPAWKGDEAGYTSLHKRVYRLRGQPNHCERCGLSAAYGEYEWANLTGNYSDVNDYQRMCITCHSSYDNERRAAGTYYGHREFMADYRARQEAAS